MKDILSTRLEFTLANLDNVENLQRLNDNRLTGLEKLHDLILEGIERPGMRASQQITDCLYQMNSLAIDVESPAVLEELQKFISILQEAQSAADKVKASSLDARSMAAELKRSRLRVEGIDVPNSLSGRANANFSTKINLIRNEIELVRDLVAQANALENGPTPDLDRANQEWQRAWNQYWENIYIPCRALFGDYVDFMRGLATRDYLLDNDGVCQLVDKLISKWDLREVSLTIPVKYVALENTVARIVRLSYQDWSIWALPMVARELSYVINSGENASPDVKAFYAAQITQTITEKHLRDYLADVFATYVMGPAYGCAALYLRFDLIHAVKPVDDHAPDAWRAEVIFQMLDWMEMNKRGFGAYTAISALLRDDWNKIMRQLGQPGLTPEEVQQIANLVDPLAKLVDKSQYGLMYTETLWIQANELSENLRDDTRFAWDSTTAPESGFSSFLSNSTDPRVVLNAAWLVRTSPLAQISVSEMERRATALANFLAGRKISPTRTAFASKQAVPSIR